MKSFYKHCKVEIILIIILTLLVQLPLSGQNFYSYAEEDTKMTEDGKAEGEEISSEEEIELQSKEREEVSSEEDELDSEDGPKEVNTIDSVEMRDREGNIIDENSEEPIKQDSAVSLYYIWSIKDGQEVKPGDYTEVKVPEEFSIFNNVEGDLVIGGGESAGRFYLDTSGNLKLVFNETAEELSNVEGTVKFNTEFNVEVIKGENPVEIVFPISGEESKTIVVRFEPENISGPVEKSGKANSSLNADRITWTIDVNKSLHKIDGAVVTDILGNGLEFDESSVKVYKLNVDLEGNAEIKGEPLKEGYTVAETDNGFTVDLGNISTAYRVTYDTKITDRTQTSFDNISQFNGGEATADVTTEKGSSIEKEGRPDKSYNPDVINWTIDVNKSLSEIEEAVVTDTLDEGLNLKEGSIKIYNLVWENGEFVEGSEVSPADYSVDEGKLSFGLGDINSAYRIKYSTDIMDETKTEFKNNATFGGETASDTVEIKRGTLIGKWGKAHIGYSEKYIDWTIDVNTRESEMKNAVVEDSFGPGQSFHEGSVEVYKLESDGNGKFTEGEEVTPQIGYIEDKGEVIGFKVTLGDIDSAYRIKYRTDITNNDQEGFSNKASIYSGTGPGTGEGKSTEITVKPEIKNYFYKDNIKNGIDYAEKTMDWKITIKPIREPIKALKIDDTFPKGGLTMLPDTIVVKRGNAELIKDTDYTLKPKEGEDWSRGFVLEFKDEVKGEDYVITYKTRFDPSTHSKGDMEYINEASFSYEGLGTTIEKSASYDISDIANNNGSKFGILDRNNKKITWSINLNYLSKNMGDFEVTDDIEENQILDKNSIKVYEYSVDKEGNITVGNLVGSNRYEITELTDHNFKIKFNSANSSYRIVFDTKIVGKTQPEYVNEAVVGDTTYRGKVSYEDSEKFVEKEGKQSGNDISWKIIVNKSLSEIDKAALIDTLSYGHEVIDDSFKVYKQPGNNLVSPDEYKVTVNKPDLTTGTQTFKFEFLNKIDSVYTIEYKTRITTEEDKASITNNVYFEGEGISTENQPFEKEIVVRITEGSGTGSGELGTLKIVKVDGSNSEIKLKGVEFELFDSNGKSKGTGKTDEEGILIIPRLKFGKYLLREIGAADGYQILGESDNSIEVEINSKEEKEVPVYNYRFGSIKIKKVDSKNGDELLKGAVFEVRDSKGDIIATLTTGEDGSASVGDLAFGEYKIAEVRAPLGYRLTSGEKDVTLNKDNIDIELTFDNDKIIPREPDEKDEPDNPEGPVKPEIPLEVVNPPKTENPAEPVIPTEPENPGEPEKSGELTEENEGKVPFGDTTVGENENPKNPSVSRLPKTGENGREKFYVAGILFILIGIVLRKKVRG